MLRGETVHVGDMAGGATAWDKIIIDLATFFGKIVGDVLGGNGHVRCQRGQQ